MRLTLVHPCVGRRRGQPSIRTRQLEPLAPATLAALTRQPGRGLRPAGSVFAGRRSRPVGLIEAGRGCPFRCEFCAITSYFGATQTRRPVEEIIEEIRRIKKPLIFFVDDNITSNVEQA